MTRARVLRIFAFASLLLGACASPAASPATSTSKAANAATRSLHALFAEEWEHDLAESPVWASSIGDTRNADRWDDLTLSAHERRQAHEREVVKKLARIPRSELSSRDRLDYDLFRRKCDEAIEGEPFRLHLLPLTQLDGIQTIDSLADGLPFDTVKHYEDWNRRLESFPRYMDQTIELLAEGARTGRTHPKIAMERVALQIEKQIVTDPAKSPFFAPYGRPSKITAADHARLAEDAKRAIAASVVPAFEKLRTFFAGTYLPACKDDVGIWQFPDGAAAYAYLVRSQTTTKLSPDEVHAIGLREVARLRGEMEIAKAKAGFSGSLKEFFAFLRTDPRFFYKDGASLLAGYRELGKRVDPLLPKLFKHLPQTGYTIAPIPDHAAPDGPAAYYREPSTDRTRKGTFFVNTYKPEARPRWEMVSLFLHEAVPGHHLQIGLAIEQANVPSFRRHAEYGAYVEGWALYAESLGEEAGLYDDPYSRMGRLTYEMWRAVRLVVDTGIHHLKWDRQHAIDFFVENAPRTLLDITNEIDRYTVWPGQALAYEIGALKIKELRKKRSAALGAKFDLREFHDAILSSGALPLDILEQRVMSGAP